MMGVCPRWFLDSMGSPSERSNSTVVTSLLFTASNSSVGGGGVESSRKKSPLPSDGLDEDEVGELLVLDMASCAG